jgi:hypothetical protein
LPGPSSGAATATTEIAAIDDEDEMLAVKTTSSPVTYSRKRKAEQSLMSHIDENDDMFSRPKSGETFGRFKSFTHIYWDDYDTQTPNPRNS